MFTMAYSLALLSLLLLVPLYIVSPSNTLTLLLGSPVIAFCTSPPPNQHEQQQQQQQQHEQQQQQQQPVSEN
jgi:hypothetical protein